MRPALARAGKFTPCVEIGWRLSADYWGGRGYATEGAKVIAARLDLSGSDSLDTAVVEAPARRWATHQILATTVRMPRYRHAIFDS